jgi:hypothetical protein
MLTDPVFTEDVRVMIDSLRTECRKISIRIENERRKQNTMMWTGADDAAFDELLEERRAAERSLNELTHYLGFLVR